MDPVSLIVSALTLGAKEIYKKEIGEAYGALKESLLKRIRKKKADRIEAVLEEFQEMPDAAGPMLEVQLNRLGIEAGAKAVQDALELYKHLPEGEQVIQQYISDNRGQVNIEHIEKLIVYQSSPNPKAVSEGDEAACDWLNLELRTYLKTLMGNNRILPLEGIDFEVCRDGESRMCLDQVYTPLFASFRDESARLGDETEMAFSEMKDRVISLVELVNRVDHPHWVFVGDPGYGKSTFLSFLSFCLAGEILGNDNENLDLLTRPLLGSEDGDEDVEPYGWTLGALFPVKVVLRDLAAKGWLAASERSDFFLDQFWGFIGSGVASDIRETVVDGIRNRFRENGGILMLDGLDEIPDAQRVRNGIKELIRAFEVHFHKVRIIVTSRPYAYEKAEWKIPGFQMARLTPFSKDQISVFISRWYDQAVLQGRTSMENAKGGVAHLTRSILSTPSLLDISRSPLLLTQLASLHLFQGEHLPEKREAIYEENLKLLLAVWERHKRYAGNGSGKTESLTELMGVNLNHLYKAIEKLAFDVHLAQGKAGGASSDGVADIKRSDLVMGLVDIKGKKGISAEALETYLTDRSGILVDRGEGIYAFPHRTFQEYLAARYLTDMEDHDELIRLTIQFPNQWREAGLLAASRIHKTHVSGFWSLIDEWCYKDVDSHDVGISDFWGALLAGLAVVESADFTKKLSENRWGKIGRLKSWLVRIVSGDELPALERASAGDVLADLGDPRFDPDRYYLPHGEYSGFITVPGGGFMMGTPEDQIRQAKGFVERETPCHGVNVPEFKISRFPVTKAQYRCFAHEVEGVDKRFEKYGKDNHPVAWVSWDDARAYCAWLCGKLGLPEGGVDLPSEAQWEKASRWGSQSLYPWGDEINSEKANYGDSAIQGTCAVGCFQGGDGEDRPLDMIGNVWEWVQDNMHGSYEGAPEDGSAWVDENADQGSIRVIRGGAFDNSAGFCRSAYRSGSLPSSRSGHLGFRLVLPPGRQA